MLFFYIISALNRKSNGNHFRQVKQMYLKQQKEQGDGFNQERTLNNMAGIREMVMVSAKAFKNSK